MQKIKKGQISIEYLVVIGFVTFLVIGLLGIAFYYTNGIQDKIRERQVESFANKVTSSADAVFFAGEPSKVTINAFLPDGVNYVTVNPADITISFNLSSGTNVQAFDSDVPLSGSIPSGSGTKTIELVAQTDSVSINSN